MTTTKKMTTSPQVHSFARECMGTFFVLQIQDEISEPEAKRMVDSAMEILDWADQTFSLYKSESELSKLNRGEIDWGSASAEQLQVRQLCEEWNQRTKGFFDARTGANYDPSGVVKVWAAANAAAFLEANGVRRFTLNAGGDVYLSTELQVGNLTRVGLSAPRSIRAANAGANFVLELAETNYRAVATSGSAERGEHIWSTTEAQRFKQATVIAEDFLTADVWATALIAGGEEALRVFRELAPREHLVAIVTTADGAVLSTAGFADLLVAL